MHQSQREIYLHMPPDLYEERKKGKSKGRKISNKMVHVTHVHQDVFHPDCLEQILSGQ